ncbi:MAG: CinA family protein [Gammaproteobacteria bacterium]|nr:CinA family protein [Gammaproteobacteria bacterium]
MDDIAQRLGAALERAGLRLVTAESCTGGWIAKRVTDVAGSSAWFERGFVSYSDASKRDLLGVRAETLASHGAVSRETALEMVAGALQRSPADVAVAVTGIAGPGGGSADKPVGTVWIAWMRRDAPALTELRRFGGDRENVRRATVRAALDGLLRILAQ